MKIFKVVYIFLGLFVYSMADCPSNPPAGLVPTSAQQSIYFYNPGYVNNPQPDNCTALIGYNVTGVGMNGILSYCTVMTPADSVILTDGVQTITIDEAKCNASNSGLGGDINLFSGTYGNFMTATVVVTTNKTAFVITFKPGQLLGNVITTVTGPTTPLYTGFPDPYGQRTELAIFVDMSPGQGGPFLASTTIPIISNFTYNLTIGTSINSPLTRVTIGRIAPQLSLCTSLGSAWAIDWSSFNMWLNTLFVTQSTGSWYSKCLIPIVSEIFGFATDTPARANTQKVLMIFASNDVNSSDTVSNLQDLGTTLMAYDVHTILVNMNPADPMPILKTTLQNTLKGSNALQYYPYGGNIDDTIKNLGTLVFNGQNLCNLNNPPLSSTPSGFPRTTRYTFPYPNGVSNQVVPQAYCGNIPNFKTAPYIPLATNYVIINVTQLQTTAKLDFIDIYQGTELIASFSGQNVAQSQICFIPPPTATPAPTGSQPYEFSIGFETYHSYVYGGAVVEIIETATACSPPPFPVTYYRRKK